MTDTFTIPLRIVIALTCAALAVYQVVKVASTKNRGFKANAKDVFFFTALVLAGVFSLVSINQEVAA